MVTVAIVGLFAIGLLVVAFAHDDRKHEARLKVRRERRARAMRRADRIDAERHARISAAQDAVIAAYIKLLGLPKWPVEDK